MDGIESQHEGQLVVLRFNVQEPAGDALRADFEARFTPTFIYFDSGGVERWRTVGSIDPESVRQTLAQDSTNG